MDIFQEHCWCEWPELFPELDFLIQCILGLWRPRISEDAAVSQCSRAELRAPLIPTNSMSSCQKLGSSFGRIFQLRESELTFQQLLSYNLIIERTTEIDVIQLEPPWFAVMNIFAPEHISQSASCVTRCRLYKYLVEEIGLADCVIHDAIQS